LSNPQKAKNTTIRRRKKERGKEGDTKFGQEEERGLALYIVGLNRKRPTRKSKEKRDPGDKKSHRIEKRNLREERKKGKETGSSGMRGDVVITR